MRSRFSPARPWRAAGLVFLSSLSLVATGAGVASAGSTGQVPATATGNPAQVLGVQLGTAAWFLLGVLLLTAGLVASSRARHRQGDSPFARPTAGQPPIWDSVSDISVVRP